MHVCMCVCVCVCACVHVCMYACNGETRPMFVVLTVVVGT